MPSADQRPMVLLTGATGFVGGHALPALQAAGYEVRCGTRDPQRAARDHPELGVEWVRLDVEARETLGPALEGCDAALYLVHSMGQGQSDYPERERAAAEAFRRSAEEHGLRRLVYLGGVAPTGKPSKHLASRIQTGEAFRGGTLDAVELRAAMVIGVGSVSWLITRDLAKRLPAMLLPAWLENHSWPIAVEDVVAAILVALQLEAGPPRCYDIPGPERLSHRVLLQRVAKIMGKSPIMIGVPLLTPRLSSYWIGAVTRAELELARELVEGLRTDLDPRGPVLWDQRPEHELVPVELAVQRALAEESCNTNPSPAAWERLTAIGERFRVT